MTKSVKITDFLTDAQIQKALELRTAKLIHEQIIEPNIKEINCKLGQENDTSYLAYAVEYAISASAN